MKSKSILTSTITERGQTTIPAKVRKALNLKPHQRITYELRDESVVVRSETENLMDLAGSLRSGVPAASKAEEREKARQAQRAKFL
ncbi:MAG TPA: type II toxin-antitoxin system PrlF family antitoxin [Chthoniobacterales bacterium]